MLRVSSEFVAALRDATIVAPELPESDAFDTLAALEEQEARLISPGKQWGDISVAEYKNGSAITDDEVQVFGDLTAQTVISADHATDPFKRSAGRYIRGDYGTGGLAILLAERGEAVSVVPLGRQTWNVAVSDESHPIKQEVGRLLPSKLGLISLHGMFSGKTRHATDPMEVHAVIGLGGAPNIKSYEAARRLRNVGEDLGLNVSIANDEALYMYDPETGGLEVDARTGELVARRLRGSKPTMMNAHAYTIMESVGEQKSAMQIELAALLRLTPIDDDGGWHRDRKAKAIGVHLGYLFAGAAAEIVALESQQ